MKTQNVINKSYCLNGQALLELTVFGAIIIMLLGVLINYGMRYNFQVQAMQEAFRKALEYAYYSTQDNKPALVSYIVIKDKHIPSPSSPFGIGSVIPISASASVTRDYHSQETASKISELPRLAIDIEGSTCPQSHDCPSGGCQPPCMYLTAGFVEFNNVQEDSVDKYTEVYSQTPEGCAKFDGAGNCIKWLVIPDEKGRILKTGVPGTEIPDPNTGETSDPKDPNSMVNYLEYTIDRIRVIDSCEGEIIDYSTAIRQCRMMGKIGNTIENDEYCKAECEKGKAPGDKRNCAELCGYDIQKKPWYCDYVTKNSDTGKYVFTPRLSAGKKNMGLQSGYEKGTFTNDDGNKLTRTEGSSGITTTESVNWQDTTKRRIVLRPFFGDKGSEAADFNNELMESVYTPNNKGKTKTMQTGW